ncbi:hypothetical protein [Actinomadura litoris]|uniref:hypothetical protein n=1 Tax=Actinomadura litoris TaxID=2678616 RepID=UPI001FA7F6FC|nr:hypothetical protein [Actinomadura litoris]
MTVSAHPLPGHGAARVPGAGPGRVRLAVCVATVAACVPYLTIKIAWLSGSTVGWNDVDAAKDSALYVGNAITMGMDAAAVLVALAFTFRWGLRIPAWAVLAPIWIAAGLLAPIAVAVPLGSALQTLTSSEPLTGTDNALQGWVYAVVYSGFTVQGLGLLTAFVLYARTRWPDVFTSRTRDVPEGATHALQRLLAFGAAGPAAVVALTDLFWALGGTAGLTADEIRDRTVLQQTVNGVSGLLTAAGAGALLLIVLRAGRPRGFVPPLAAAWVGSGATFAGSLYALLVMLGRPAHLASGCTVAEAMTALGGVLAGLVMGLTGAVLLVEKSVPGGAGGRPPAADPDGQMARPIASSTP